MIQSSTDYLILVCFAHEDMKKSEIKDIFLYYCPDCPNAPNSKVVVLVVHYFQHPDHGLSRVIARYGCLLFSANIYGSSLG